MYKQLLKYDKLFGAQNYKPLSVILERGSGAHLFDINIKNILIFYLHTVVLIKDIVTLNL